MNKLNCCENSSQVDKILVSPGIDNLVAWSKIEYGTQDVRFEDQRLCIDGTWLGISDVVMGYVDPNWIHSQ